MKNLYPAPSYPSHAFAPLHSQASLSSTKEAIATLNFFIIDFYSASLEFHINGSIQCLLLFQALLLSAPFLTFSYIGASIGNSFLPGAE